MLQFFEIFFTNETTLTTIETSIGTTPEYSEPTLWTTESTQNDSTPTFEPFPEEPELKWEIVVILDAILIIALSVSFAIICKKRKIWNKISYRCCLCCHCQCNSSEDIERPVLIYNRSLENQLEDIQLPIIYNPLRMATNEEQEPPDYDTVAKMELPSYEEITSTC